jgi:hypothetical protein
MSERLTDSGAPEAAAGEDSTVMGGLQGGVSGAFGPESLAEAAAGKQYPGAKPTAGRCKGSNGRQKMLSHKPMLQP